MNGKRKSPRLVGSSDIVRRICATCDNWSEDRMRCDYEPDEPCPPECSCDSWTPAETDSPNAADETRERCLQQLCSARITQDNQ